MKALVGAFNQEKAVWNRWIVCSTSLQFQIIRLYRSASCSVVSPLLLPHHLELLGQCTLIIVMRHSLTLISLVRLQIELIKTFIIHVHVLPKFQSLNAILSFSPSCNSCWVTHYACYLSVSGPGLGVPVSPCRGVASYRVSGSGLELCRVKLSILHSCGDILMEDHLTSAKPPTIYKITAGAVISSALLFILINFATIKIQLHQTLQPNHQ